MELHLFGDGALRAEVEAALRAGALLRSHGVLSDVGRVYSAFDGLLAPSRFEGAVPLSVLDALAVGLPVAATACPGVAGDPAAAALLVIPDLTVEALCSAAARLPRTRSPASPPGVSAAAMCASYRALYARIAER